MKRFTLVLDDDSLYREVKVAAAREGRTVKDLVAEALRDWLQRRVDTGDTLRERRLDALEALRRLRGRQPLSAESAEDILGELRLERSLDRS